MKSENEYKGWNDCHIELLDIRVYLMAQGEVNEGYRLPASAFLFVHRGKARVWIDEQLQLVNHAFFFHGYPGMCLDIWAEEALEYYLILYRADWPIRRRFALGKASVLPDQQTFSFVPRQPFQLYQVISSMEEVWRRSTDKEKLKVKAFFYSFLLEMLQQKHQGSESSTAEVIKQVIDYMQQHLAEPLSLETLGRAFGYHAQYLARKFKETTGSSPIDFLIRLRIEAACQLLQRTDASIGEIARNVGYEDLFYFNRIFKKNTGLSPSQFKKERQQQTDVCHSPYKRLGSSMERRPAPYYSDGVTDNDYHTEGASTMGKVSSSNLAAALVMGLALLLSACGGGGALPNQAGAPAAAVQSVATESVNTSSSQQAQSTATKVVNTIFGDVEIPAQAKRIAAIQYLSSIVAVKGTPIATTTRIMENPYFDGLVDDIEIVGASGSEVSMEKLIDLEPDLIIVMTSSEAEYEMFSKVAPTIAIPYGAFSSIEEEVKFFGELLGRKTEATEWLNDYDARVAKARSRVEAVIPADATFRVIQDTDKVITAFSADFGRGGQAIYENLGRRAPEQHWEELKKEQYQQISKEVLEEYAADYMVLTTEKSLDEIRSDPFWSKLDAVKNNRVYVWSNKRSYFIDPVSVLYQTEELADWLTGTKK